MSATHLNTVRATIESRLVDELTKAPPLPVVFYNQPFSSKDYESFVQCLTTFGATEYLSQGTSSTKLNTLTGLLVLNIFTPEGEGSGNNLIIANFFKFRFSIFNSSIFSSISEIFSRVNFLTSLLDLFLSWYRDNRSLHSFILKL